MIKSRHEQTEEIEFKLTEETKHIQVSGNDEDTTKPNLEKKLQNNLFLQNCRPNLI